MFAIIYEHVFQYSTLSSYPFNKLLLVISNWW
jgi:hypothetical protein